MWAFMVQIRIRRGTGKGRRLMDKEDEVEKTVRVLTVLGSVAEVVTDDRKVGRRYHEKKQTAASL